MPIKYLMKFHSFYFLLIFSVFSAVSLSAEKPPLISELPDAAAVGNIQKALDLLNRGADPDRTGIDGKTPLMFAVENGDYKMAELLLKAGAKPDAGNTGKYPTPLISAVKSNRNDLVKILLFYGADPDVTVNINGITESAYSASVNMGFYDLVRLLINHGANPYYTVVPENGYIDNIVNPNNYSVINIPLDDRLWKELYYMEHFANSPDWSSVRQKERWVLHFAAEKNNWSDARDLLDKGFYPDLQDENGVTPLMSAAYNGSTEVFNLLIQRGAEIYIKDKRSHTVLDYACAGGNPEITETLLTLYNYSLNLEPAWKTEKNADIKNIFGGFYPYFLALAGGSHTVLEKLVSSGFIPDGTDNREGITLLMTAAWLSDYYAVSVLMPVSDAAVKDNAGRSALEWSLAAFLRDRKSSEVSGISNFQSRNYPIISILASRGRDPEKYVCQPAMDVSREVLNAWNPGITNDQADDWRRLLPSPVPELPGGGDAVVYKILRDEETEN